MKRYFKVLDENGTTRNCGDVIVWSLPTYDKDKGWSPGKWMPPAEGELVLYGYKEEYCEIAKRRIAKYEMEE